MVVLKAEVASTQFSLIKKKMTNFQILKIWPINYDFCRLLKKKWFSLVISYENEVYFLQTHHFYGGKGYFDENGVYQGVIFPGVRFLLEGPKLGYPQKNQICCGLIFCQCTIMNSKLIDSIIFWIVLVRWVVGVVMVGWVSGRINRD